MIETLFHPHRPDRERRHYRIAGRPLAVDAPLAELAPFASAPPRPAAGPGPAAGRDRRRPAPGRRRLLYRGPAELGARRFDLECRWHDGGYDLALAGLGRVAVAADGGRIVFDTPRDGGDGRIEVFLGPALTLALALQGVFGLHASAVEIGDGVSAFVGESGKGKSTLARLLPERSPAFRRVADDLLPVTLEAGAARVRPRFPQLKYPPDRQPGAALPPSLPLDAVYLLDPRPADEPAVAVETLDELAAVLTLARHTMAACLFTPALLRRHTELCAGLARRVPVRRLVYPKVPESVPRIAELVRRAAATPSPGASS